MDKRQFFRFNMNLEVKYRILESLGVYQTTSTEDVCEKGIRINLPEYIEPGKRLELTVRIPDQMHPIMAIGRVVWVKKGLFSNFFTIGIHLTYISEQDREKFYKYAVL